MVLVSYILDNYVSILQTKFSDREGHEARRIGLEAVPLDQHVKGRHGEREVVYPYRAGNSVACKTGIMPPFHHHERGQRDGIPPLFLPVGAVGSALAVLHVACCLAQ